MTRNSFLALAWIHVLFVILSAMAVAALMAAPEMVTTASEKLAVSLAIVGALLTSLLILVHPGK